MQSAEGLTSLKWLLQGQAPRQGVPLVVAMHGAAALAVLAAAMCLCPRCLAIPMDGKALSSGSTSTLPLACLWDRVMALQPQQVFQCRYAVCQNRPDVLHRKTSFMFAVGWGRRVGRRLLSGRLAATRQQRLRLTHHIGSAACDLPEQQCQMLLTHSKPCRCGLAPGTGASNRACPGCSRLRVVQTVAHVGVEELLRCSPTFDTAC